MASILRITGLCRERRFVNYHRVLNRAAWSERAAACVLLRLLLDAFVPKGPVLLGLLAFPAVRRQQQPRTQERQVGGTP